MAMIRAGAAVVAMCALLAGCATAVPGTATWPGAVLNSAMLGAGDFPSGAQYDRIIERPGMPDGADVPGSMLSRPEGCSNALTNVIATTAERGPGSAAKYAVSYDGVGAELDVVGQLRAGIDDRCRMNACHRPFSSSGCTSR